MARLKDRPGAKVLAGLPVHEKLITVCMGSKVGPAAWIVAAEREREIIAYVDGEIAKFDGRDGKTNFHEERFHSDVKAMRDRLCKGELLREAAFHRQVATAFERLAAPADLTYWLASLLVIHKDAGRPAPTKAEALELLRGFPAVQLKGTSSDQLKQLARAERYLGIKLPQARPGRHRKS
jgi:hypothetical protein